jgi:hypothetical protein
VLFGIMNWLDTETKALLQRDDQPTLVPAKVSEFALVLGSSGVDKKRLIRAVCRINECDHSTALDLLRQPPPVVINSDLTEEDATLGQFELVCCAAVSAVVRSEVAVEGDREYLSHLLASVSCSSEFRPITIRVDDVPMTEAGQNFADQFLGMDVGRLRELGFPRRFTMPAKKARIMKHWAARIGAKVGNNTAEPGAAPNAAPPHR